MEQEAPRRSTRRSTHRSKAGQQNSVDLSREPRFMQEWYPSKPWDVVVLTVDPSSHLSHRASSGIKDDTMKGYGGVCAVKDVWANIPDSVKTIVLNSCFGPLLRVALSIDENNRVLVRGLMELFWDTTNTFHMPHCEMTITPLDFSMSAGVSFEGNDVIYNRDFGSKTDVLQEMYGTLATEFPTDGSRSVSYSLFSGVFDDTVFMCTFGDDQLARCFITYLLSATIFADRSNKTWFHYLPCLKDLSRMGEYNWGAAGYANLLQHLRRACRVKDKSNLEHFTKASIGGFWNVLEPWFYEYFPACFSHPAPKAFPAITRWAQARSTQVEEHGRHRWADLNSFRDFVNDATLESMCLSPWEESSWMEVQVPSSARVAADLVEKRVLFKGPFGYVWYLGERVGVQHNRGLVVPVDPPLSMFQLTETKAASLNINNNIPEVLTLPTVDYKAFRETRLAPPILRCEIRCRVRLPEPRVKVRGVNGEETFVEIPDHLDPVPELPFPPDFKGFDRTESEKLWRLLHSSMSRVAELTSFVDLWTSAPRLSVMGSCPTVGSTHFPQRLSELERLLSVASSLQQQNASKGEPSRKRRLVRQQTIESDSESDKSVG